jgi:pimeloyl-ACP methyl ester carboxylesterase
MMRWILIALLAVAAVFTALFFVDMRSAYERIGLPTPRVSTARLDIEYTQGGSGIPVLVIHGSGGGHDQGELIAQAVLGAGFRWITPSRFGYLRSSLPEGASFDEQAHAYAQLLDALGLDQVAVVAMSHGGPSALLFALLHPERVASLTLLSCGVASASDDDQAQASRKGDLLTTVFRYDVLYWAVSRFLRGQLMTLMGADPAIVAGLAPRQRQLVDDVIAQMNPVAPRSAGVVFDNRAAMPNDRIAGIRAPTLVLHAKDDGLQLFRNARFAAAKIPGARLVAFDRGGHLLIAVEQEAVRAQVQAFIRQHDGAAASSATASPGGTAASTAAR